MIFQYYLAGKEHADELRKKHDEEMIKAKTAEERAQISFKYDKLMQDYLQSLQQKKFDELGRDPKKLYEDAVQYIPTLIEHEYRSMTYGHNEISLKELERFGNGEYKDGKFYVYDFLMLAYVSTNLNSYLDVLADNEEYREKLRREIIKAVIASPYTCSQKDGSIYSADNMPMYNGKPVKLMAKIKGEPKISKAAGIATYKPDGDNGNAEFILNHFSSLKGNVSINTHKLLCVAIAEFTRANTYNGGIVKPEIILPLKEHARSLNYRVDEEPTSTPEEAEKEKKRAAAALKDARKKIKNDLELLLAMQWSWKGEDNTEFSKINLFERVGIENGYIKITFGQTMSEYLKKRPLTQYPKGLLAIDARSDNAYRIGLKLAEHYNMYSNIVNETNNRLSVKTLLNVTSLPTYDELKNKKQDLSRQWETKIKEHFETALDTLTGKVIKDWEYVKPGGLLLTDKEASNITNYDTFANLLVKFELINPKDQTAQIKKNLKEKEKAIKAKKSRERKKSAKQSKKAVTNGG